MGDVNHKAKNLFDFATKELSQDAFLRWLIESVNNPDVASVSRAFLKWLTGYNGKIEVVRTAPQWKRIDVVAELFCPKTCESIVLAIEDKVDAGEHDDQLNKYGKKLEEWQFVKPNLNGRRTFRKVFYKTAHLHSLEKQRILEMGWVVFELDDVATFFEKFEYFSKSEIVRSYAKHVLGRKRVSDKSMEAWSIENFAAWFWEIVLPDVQQALPGLNIEPKIYRGDYFSCFMSKPFKYNRSVCLEIKFRPASRLCGCIYPRKDPGTTLLPDNAWNVPEAYRKELRTIIETQSTTVWSAFRRLNCKNCVGGFKKSVSIKDKGMASVQAELCNAIEEFYWLFDVDMG